MREKQTLRKKIRQNLRMKEKQNLWKIVFKERKKKLGSCML